MTELSPSELNHINEEESCPDCKTGRFLEGPRAGLSINVRCDHCGHEFCLSGVSHRPDKMGRSLVQGPIWVGQRMERNDLSLYQRGHWVPA